MQRLTDCMERHGVVSSMANSLQEGMVSHVPDEDGSLGFFGRVLRGAFAEHFHARRTYDVPWRDWILCSMQLVAEGRLEPTELLEIRPLFKELLEVDVPSSLCGPTGRLLWTFGARCREVEPTDEDLLYGRNPKRAYRTLTLLTSH